MGKRVCAMLAVLLVTTALVTGCAASRAFREGQEATKVGDWDAAVAHFTKALQDEPDQAEYKIELERASLAASRIHFDKARAFEEKGELEAAVYEYHKTTEFDPSYRQAIS